MSRTRYWIVSGLSVAATVALGVQVTGCGLFSAPVKPPPPMPDIDWGFGDDEEKEVEIKEKVVIKEVQPKIKTHDGLNSTLWVQTSVEYDANTQQAYEVAQLQLDKALAQKTWTAALEQEAATDFATKPPAIIVDVDETVLDNSPYQARLARDKKEFKPESWNAWVNEKKAQPVPGALEFAQYAQSKGVTVFYVTNRDSSVEEPTRQNLQAHGFPIDDTEDVVLTKGERPEWDTSDKTPRRQHVANSYRVLLIVGDNFGDFVGEDYKGSVSQRDLAASSHKDRWGERWIILPNPLYGSWESAIFGHDYSKDGEVRSKAKWDALKP